MLHANSRTPYSHLKRFNQNTKCNIVRTKVHKYTFYSPDTKLKILTTNMIFIYIHCLKCDRHSSLLRLLFVYAVFGGGCRRYAVHKWSVRSSQKSCYIVRRHQFLFLKGPIFSKKHNKREIQLNNSEFFARSIRSRYLGVILAFINLNIDFGS